jgi:hypothetical protein
MVLITFKTVAWRCKRFWSGAMAAIIFGLVLPLVTIKLNILNPLVPVYPCYQIRSLAVAWPWPPCTLVMTRRLRTIIIILKGLSSEI